jgi:sugar lactone lactonase YvrE
MRSLGEAAPASDVRTRLGEGPRWDGRRLLWVDIEGQAIHRSDGDPVPVPAMVGAVAPWAGDVVLAALADRLAAVDLATGAVDTVVELPSAPGVRSNDGACDPLGRFWIGTMALDESPGRGALYRLDADGSLHTVLEGVGMSNGLGWSGERMYWIDSLEQTVFVLEGAERRPFARVDPDDGTPDGLAVDDAGGVWVALHGGGAVRRYAPDGSLDAVVAVPVPETTACCFAGSRLYVTARSGLFALDVPFSGPPATPFGGRRTAPSAAEDTSAR